VTHWLMLARGGRAVSVSSSGRELGWNTQL